MRKRERARARERASPAPGAGSEIESVANYYKSPPDAKFITRNFHLHTSLIIQQARLTAAVLMRSSHRLFECDAFKAGLT